jgi:hypothetical protein
MSESFYKHTVTGKVARLNDTFAAVFGDVLTSVDSPDGEVADKRSSKKSVTTKTDSPKEGND